MMLLGIVACAAALRFWGLGDPGLIGDESYYWLWSERLAPSYFDHPAGVAVMIRLSTLVLGKSESGIRWLNASLGLGSVVLCYAIGSCLFSRGAGLLAAGMVGLGAPYLIISRFAYIDALQLFLLLLNVYLILPIAMERERVPTTLPSWRFWAVGLSMALLFNTKYSAYLYGLAIGAIVLLSRPALVRDWRTWGSVGIAMCGLLPTLWWNATNQWASFRWQIEHFVQGAVHQSTFFGGLWHAFLYLTPPVACLAALGATQLRTARERLLLVPALLLTVPVLLSPANSPRNLIVGTALLLLLAAGAMQQWIRRRSPAVALLVLSVLAAWTGAYGLGTVLGTLSPTPLPHSSVATAIRRDAQGWRDARGLNLDPEVPVFALDYSIASQLRYYTGLPVQTAWGQYRLWGIRDVCEPREDENDALAILALSYVDPVVVSQRLRSAFREVHGPAQVSLGDADGEKRLRIWTVRGCAIDVEDFLRRFDFVALIQEGSTR
jgi:hypothetical protein